jgi:hypothetical protein
MIGSTASRAGLLSALAYLGVTAAFFAPLVLGGSGERLSSQLIGEGDNLESLWNAWWIGQSLGSLGNPWFTDLLFAPEGVPLVWHSLAPLGSGVVALLSQVVPVPLAYNAAVIAALPVAGLSCRALCRRFTDDELAAFTGGLAFMLCPFVTSRTLGHLDLLYGGLLPFFYLQLLRAVEAPGHAAGWRLAGAAMLLLFTCNPSVPVFAANLAFFLLCRYARREGFGPAVRRFARVFAPTLLLALPWLVLVAAYAIAWDYPPRSHADLDYDPELLSYLLPLTRSSSWWPWTRGLVPASLHEVEPAVYLGLGVLPVALAGLWSARREPMVRHLALLGAVFLVFSMGPKLQWHREVVQVAGLDLYLPFGLWRWVPVLGGVGQAGRYALIVYMVMGVGVACAVARLRQRVAERASPQGDSGRARALGFALAFGIAALVCVDFAFSPTTRPLPRPLDLAEDAPQRRRMLDPRLSHAPTMYQQTLCGRPLVGGYVSRTPPGPLASYRADPVLAWFFSRDPVAPPTRDALHARLQELAVGDVLLDPADPRGPVLAALGFEKRDGNADTTVWSR